MTRALSLWSRVPALVRAPVAALLILTAAVYPSMFLFQMNLEHGTGVPWAVAPGAVYLFLLWRYVGGSGPPARTRSSRARLRRYGPIRTANGLWSWIAGASLTVTIISYGMIHFLTETGGVRQAAMLEALAPLPATTVLPLLVLMVGMTAFFEEAAFRGYMQVQLEDRYGPAVAIGLTALLFAAVHGLPVGHLPLFVFGSLGFGVLAYQSGTILPAVVAHGAIDGAIFLWAWMRPDAFRALLEHNVLRTGIDGPFAIWVAVAVLASAATIGGFVMLARSRPAVREA